MDEPTFETALSRHDTESIQVRNLDLTSEVMGELPFPAAMYYLWTGEEPTAGEVRLVDAMLSSLMVHGTTAPAIAARLTAHTEPEATQAAIASGILGVGSRFVGTMKGCARHLRDIEESDDREAAVADLVADFRERGAGFPGIGHPHLHPVDPRAETLFEMADEEDIAGDHVAILADIQEAFEAATGADLPINVTGAIAAVGTDMGLSPDALRGIAVISRAAGVTGEVLEEHEHPYGGDIWNLVDSNTVDTEEE